MQILICGNYGVKNTGDEAMLLGFKSLVQKILPEAKMAVMGAGMHFPFGLRSLFISLFKPALWRKPYQLFKSCDVFVLGGGGLFSQEESYFSPLFWVFHGLFAVWKEKPVYCMGISISPLKGVSRFFVKKLFSRAKSIVVRDRASQELLKEWGINSYLGSDLALGIEFENRDVHNQENYVVLSFRPFNNFDEKLCTIIAQFCDSIIQKFGLKIRFIPFHDNREFDRKILNKIFDRMTQKEHATLDQFYENIDELLCVLTHASMVVGMRLHSGIMSAIAETPFLPLSYMTKVDNFWSEFPEINSLKIRSLKLDELLYQFELLWNSRREKRALVSRIKQTLEKRNAQLHNLLASWRSINK